MATLTFFLILLGASGLFSKEAESKPNLAGDYYDSKKNPKAPASPTVAPKGDFFQAPSPDGTFRYSFHTDNGIYVKAKGYPMGLGPEEKAQVMEGSYSYTAPDGAYVLNLWYADETGFHPTVIYKKMSGITFPLSSRAE